MNDITLQLLNILKQENVTQYKLAKELKLSQSYLNEVLNNKKKFRTDYLIKICDYLGYEIKIEKKNINFY
jgi:transcriptional regulator with XRE-family HTH domain